MITLPSRGLPAAWRVSGGRIGAGILIAIVLIAVVGPHFLPDPAAQPDIIAGPTPPGPGHLFGTDELNRDILARVVGGARISLLVALLAVALSITVGAVVGLAAGYMGGWIDIVLMRLVDAALAIPRLFVLLLLLAVWEKISLVAFIVAIGATGWFATSRLVRSEVLRLRGEPFVLAARSLGASRRRIAFRHLLPNTLGPIVVTATLGVGHVILLEAGLSFLGLGGVRPPTPSWGRMILDAKPVLETAPWAGLFPGLAIIVTVLAANLVGEALRTYFDPQHA